jgi:hypothetical protein
MTTIDSTTTANAVDAMSAEELLRDLEGLAPPEGRAEEEMEAELSRRKSRAKAA